MDNRCLEHAFLLGLLEGTGGGGETVGCNGRVNVAQTLIRAVRIDVGNSRKYVCALRRSVMRAKIALLFVALCLAGVVSAKETPWDPSWGCDAEYSGPECEALVEGDGGNHGGGGDYS